MPLIFSPHFGNFVFAYVNQPAPCVVWGMLVFEWVNRSRMGILPQYLFYTTFLSHNWLYVCFRFKFDAQSFPTDCYLSESVNSDIAVHNT